MQRQGSKDENPALSTSGHLGAKADAKSSAGLQDERKMHVPCGALLAC